MPLIKVIRAQGGFLVLFSCSKICASLLLKFETRRINARVIAVGVDSGKRSRKDGGGGEGVFFLESARVMGLYLRTGVPLQVDWANTKK